MQISTPILSKSGIHMSNVELLLPSVRRLDKRIGKGEQKIGSKIMRKRGRYFVKALDGIDITIKPGDRVALIGHNGAGKTTLMRTICGIYTPTSGKQEINGSISTLFSSTLGLDQNATGLECIQFALSLYGIPHSAHVDYVEDIVEFSGLGDFLYMPVGDYSAGMKTRLGFSIATSIKPEILIIDEVLSAGDMAFAEKAKSRILEFTDSVQILIVASHSGRMLNLLCNKAIWMDNGRVKATGPFQEVWDEYVASRVQAPKAILPSANEELAQDLVSENIEVNVPANMYDEVKLVHRGLELNIDTRGSAIAKKAVENGRFPNQDFLTYTHALGLKGTYVSIGEMSGYHNLFWSQFSEAKTIHAFMPEREMVEIAQRNIELNPIGTPCDIHLMTRNENDNHALQDLSILIVDVPSGIDPHLKSLAKQIKNEAPIIFVQTRSNSSKQPALIKTLAAIGYSPTGRVFNSPALIEFWPKNHKRSEELERRILVNDQRHISWSCSNKMAWTQLLDDALLIHLDASPMCYVTPQMTSFDLPVPNVDERLSIQPGHRLLFEISAKIFGSVHLSVNFNQYDNRRFLHQDKIYIMERTVFPVKLVEGATSVRIILQVKGIGRIEIPRICLTSVAPS